MPTAWLAAAAARADRLRASALAGVRAWAHGWPPHLTVLGAARTFVTGGGARAEPVVPGLRDDRHLPGRRVLW
jgi:hypothetical protein